MSLWRRWQDVWFCAAVLLVAFVLRAHQIEALPPFNDESLHIRRAEQILSNRDISLTPFKLLVYYWVWFFQPERLQAIFIGRTAVALFSLMGLAGTYATARYLFGRWAGRVALILATFSPFMIFFDRLTFADPLTASLAILLVWMALRLVRAAERGKGRLEAVLAGVLGTLIILAKTTGAPFLVMPFLAILLFGKGDWPASYGPKALWQWGWEKIWRYGTVVKVMALAFGVSMAPFGLHVLERTISGNYVMLVNNNLVLGLAEDRPPHEIIWQNLITLWKVNWILHSPLVWIGMLAAVWGLWRWQRAKGLYLLGAVVLPWILSVFLGAELSTRYLTLGVLPLMVILAGGLACLVEHSGRWSAEVKMALSAGVGLWCVAFGLQFVVKAWDDPTQLHLPERDRWEYFENFGAGYGLVDAARDIEQLPISEPSGRVNVIGLVGSCHQMRLYLHGAENEDEGKVWLSCPFFGWWGEFLDDVADEIQARLAVESQVYLLIEPDIPYFDVADLEPRWKWEEVERYSRPFKGMEIVLYHISPKDH